MRARDAVPLLLALTFAPWALAQDGATDADDPRRIRAELAALRKELKDVKARLAHLEQQMAGIAAQASDTTKPALDPTLGFVVPGVPHDAGSDSASALATFLHHTATTGEHDLEKLLAYNRIDFLVPESLWNQAAKGLKTVPGLPTRDELELALAVLKAAGPGAPLTGLTPLPELAPPGNSGYVQVVDFNVDIESRTARFRLTAVKLCGRWFAAHLLAISAEEDAKAFLADLWESQRAYNAFRQGRYAPNLHELAGARELEKNPSIKAAHMSFPLGARLDRLEKDKLEWVGNDLRGPFYRFTLSGDDKGGWSAVAVPRTQSYWTYSLTVSATADLTKKPEIKRHRASSGDAPEPKKREGEPEGD